MDREGNSFEREAIHKWIALNGTSPVTRNPCTVNELVPNRALKELINHLKSMQTLNSGLGNLKLEAKIQLTRTAAVKC